MSSNSKALWTSLKSLVPNAIFNTYSYSPFVGMTSQTDPTGVTTNYTYDLFGRLEYTKDDDQYLRNRYIYHYAVPSYLTLSSNYLYFLSVSNAKNVTVTSTTTWTITEVNGSFITATKINSNTLSIGCAENIRQERSGTVKLTNGIDEAIINITQYSPGGSQ
jgi:hypothetical protein